MDETTQNQQPASVYVDREMCQTALTCLAYGLYELDDEEKAVILTRNGGNSDDPRNELAPNGVVRLEDVANDTGRGIEEMRELALESAKACPFNAIIVRDADGNQLWPPA